MEYRPWIVGKARRLLGGASQHSQASIEHMYPANISAETGGLASVWVVASPGCNVAIPVVEAFSESSFRLCLHEVLSPAL